MNIDTSPDNSTVEHKQSELREVRADLREKQTWIPEDKADLYHAVSKWIQASYNLPMGSIEARVRSRLMSLPDRPEHKFRDHRGVDNPEEAFPDDCSDCVHYGGRCPVMASKLGGDTLERLFDEASSDEELLGLLSQYASGRSCEVLKQEIGSGQDQYREFVQVGEQLRTRVNAAVSEIDLDDADDDLPFDLGSGGGTDSPLAEPPSDDIGERVAEITAAVTGPDEEEEDG